MFAIDSVGEYLLAWIAFGILGLLVGNLTGLSASPITSVLVPTLFTLFGGSLLAYFSKLDEAMRQLSSRSLASFSLMCLLGLYAGIIVNTHRLLGPPPFQTIALEKAEPKKKDMPDAQTVDMGHGYLRSDTQRDVDLVIHRVATGELPKEQGYDELAHALQK